MSVPRKNALVPSQAAQLSIIARASQSAHQAGSVLHPPSAAQAPYPVLPSCQSLIAAVDARRNPGIYIMGPPHMPTEGHGAYLTEFSPVPGRPVPKFYLVHFPNEQALFASFKTYGDPTVTFEWPGYKHLSRQFKVPMQQMNPHDSAASAFIQGFLKRFTEFVNTQAENFQGPGIRLGLHGCPVQSVRLKSISLASPSKELNTWRAEVVCALSY